MEENEQTPQEPTLEQQLAEAEERGYRRGLNEQIEQQMNRPGAWEGSVAASPARGEAYTVLATAPRSIWDTNQPSTLHL